MTFWRRTERARRDARDEIRLYLEMRTEELRRQGMLATLLPARAAARVDPLEVLRAE